ncbi:MAG TPA: hypothetical protein VNM67_21425 [Thermoanaerobaculia bacterium]|jgi:hypothetical protein|nr:hypothetical protein [Thermoanaerobaculia bacterium]
MQRALVLAAPRSFSFLKLGEELRSVDRDGIPEFKIAAEPTGLDIRWTADPTRYVDFSIGSHQQMAIDDYLEETDHDLEFRRRISEQVIYVLLSNSVPLLRRILEMALEHIARKGEDAWVDDDHGNVAPAAYFLKRLKEESSWNLKIDEQS